jgi:hypothetical protein
MATNPMVMLFLEIYPGLQTPFFAEAKGVIATQSVSKFSTRKYDYCKNMTLEILRG